MNIYYLSDNMARLTPTTGSIRHVLSNRTYKEVRCPLDAIHMYTDGHPNEGYSGLGSVAVNTSTGLPMAENWSASGKQATVTWA